jgi:hypothetical protein
MSSVVTVTACPLLFSETYGPNMPYELSPHHTVAVWLCKGEWARKRGFSSAEYLKFFLLIYLLRLKWASSDVIKFGRNFRSVPFVSNRLVQNSPHMLKSRGSNSCTIWILNLRKCKSMCTVLLTLLSAMSSGTDCRLAERRRATRTLPTSSGMDNGTARTLLLARQNHLI